ncbi:unnamed protein product [Ambrosiozyma monospora]|uniref:Unnamed protein product n=1 Tax=Ambrosiozyma monospora TaxID=43982 RepID=A0ACB5UBY6_AMBMO|nr:unnamed protein product [Ambrosiozyma monospora]
MAPATDQKVSKIVKSKPRKPTTEEKARKAQRLAQQNVSNFIKITSPLPAELQEQVFADALEYADLILNHKLFADITKKNSS